MSTKLRKPLIDCYANAEPEEEMFILLARDQCAPDAIEAWALARIKQGLNHRDDQQITEALNTAAKMRADREWIRKIISDRKERR
jgi:hypothetical protein